MVCGESWPRHGRRKNKHSSEKKPLPTPFHFAHPRGMGKNEISAIEGKFEMNRVVDECGVNKYNEKIQDGRCEIRKYDNEKIRHGNVEEQFKTVVSSMVNCEKSYVNRLALTIEIFHARLIWVCYLYLKFLILFLISLIETIGFCF
jgi:hypothetical protein